MTELEARAELAAALTTAEVPTGPPVPAMPCAVLYGDGMDPSHFARGQLIASTRIVLLAGAWDAPAAADILAGLRAATLAVLRALPGWELRDVRRDAVVNHRGGLVLTCDVIARRAITIE